MVLLRTSRTCSIVIIVPILALMFLFYKSQPKVYNKLDYILFSRKKVMTETKTDTQQQQMLRGTAWMTASNIISRLLGALYIIPWYAWMGKQGDQANALFGQGYNIYALFLLISTAGIPVAIAKQVSKYNTLGKWRRVSSYSSVSCIT